MSDDERCQRAARFVGALSDEERLRIAARLLAGAWTVGDLGAALGLPPAAVARHLARLEQAGLVERPPGEPGRWRLDRQALRDYAAVAAPEAAALERPTSPDPWADKVLHDFFVGERLKEVPASRKKRLVVLIWLAERFEPGRAYPEREVNLILQRHHPDFAWLRRELVDHRLLLREGGVYWRPAEADK